jgi:hypothetical protein
MKTKVLNTAAICIICCMYSCKKADPSEKEWNALTQSANSRVAHGSGANATLQAFVLQGHLQQPQLATPFYAEFLADHRIIDGKSVSTFGIVLHLIGGGTPVKFDIADANMAIKIVGVNGEQGRPQIKEAPTVARNYLINLSKEDFATLGKLERIQFQVVLKEGTVGGVLYNPNKRGSLSFLKPPSP